MTEKRGPGRPPKIPRNVQIPGDEQAPAMQEQDPGDEVERPTPEICMVTDRSHPDYWKGRKAAEAQAFWEALPADKRGQFNVLCADGWYCAPWSDPRLVANASRV